MPLVQQIDGGRLVERQESREQSANTKAAKQMREEEDLDLRELVESFGTDQAYAIKLIRRKPKMWGNPPISIEGHIDTFDEWVPEEEIQEMYGGGTYTIKVCKPNAKGSMVYFKSGTLKLPGPPKGPNVPSMDDDDDDDDRHYLRHHPASYEDTSVVSQAISTMQGIIESQKSSGMDPALIAAITTPMQMQVQALQESLRTNETRVAEKDNKIMELLTRPVERPDTSANDRLMDKMFDSTNSRMEAIRINHESEMRMIRENHRDDVKRIEDRYERQIDSMRESHNRQIHSMEEAHKREIASVTRSSDALNSASQIGFTSQIEVHKMENERLRGDLAALRAEVVELRAKKEKTLFESAQELALFSEKMSSLGLGGFGRDEEDEPHWSEKLISGVIENPEIVSTVAKGISGAGQQFDPQQQQFQQQPMPQQPMPQQPQGMPPRQLQPGQPGQQPEQVRIEDIEIGQPFRGGDGEVYVKVPPDGDIVTYEEALRMAREEEAENRKAAEEAAAEEARKPTKQQVQIAISFAEAAYKNNTPPQVFAQTARNSIPGGLLNYIGEVGVDTFLNEVATLEQTSPLKTQAGRNYMRQVAEFLLDGEVR